MVLRTTPEPRRWKELRYFPRQPPASGNVRLCRLRGLCLCVPLLTTVRKVLWVIWGQLGVQKKATASPKDPPKHNTHAETQTLRKHPHELRTRFCVPNFAVNRSMSTKNAKNVRIRSQRAKNLLRRRTRSAYLSLFEPRHVCYGPCVAPKWHADLAQFGCLAFE